MGLNFHWFWMKTDLHDWWALEMKWDEKPCIGRRCRGPREVAKSRLLVAAVLQEYIHVWMWNCRRWWPPTCMGSTGWVVVAGWTGGTACAGYEDRGEARWGRGAVQWPTVNFPVLSKKNIFPGAYMHKMHRILKSADDLDDFSQPSVWFYLQSKIWTLCHSNLHRWKARHNIDGLIQFEIQSL